jgi:hypothetical protein
MREKISWGSIPPRLSTARCDASTANALSRDPVHEERGAEERLPTAGAAGHEGGPSAWQPAERDLVETRDPRCTVLHRPAHDHTPP